METLEGYFHTEADKDPQPEIHLRPDRRAKYDVVARVLAAAQRNRMKKIGFVNTANSMTDTAGNGKHQQQIPGKTAACSWAAAAALAAQSAVRRRHGRGGR